MNRKTGIIISLILAIICTLLIYVNANRKYTAVTRGAVALQATEYIPAGEKLTPGMFKAVNVPQQLAQDLATGSATGFTEAPILKNQFLMKDDLSATGCDPGYVEVYVPVDVPSSACASSGDYVDVYTKSQNNSPSSLLYKKAKVLDVVDASAKEAAPGGQSSGVSMAGSGTAVAIGIEVPDAQAASIVGPASQKLIYLVRSAV